MRVVVVGAGFGGLEVVKNLANRDIEVLLVDRENHHLFQPLLYQVATAGLAPGSIAHPIRSVVGRHKNVRVLLSEADSVDRETAHLVMKNGDRIHYDYLVIATGAKVSYFGNDTWKKHTHGLKDIRDAIRIRERILLAYEQAEHVKDPVERARLLTFVAIGGGPTGVEMAGAMAELGKQVLAADYHQISPDDIRVVLIEMGDRVLAPFSTGLSYSAEAQLRDLGVSVSLGSRVVDVDERGVSYVDTKGEQHRVDASVTVWAAGVKAGGFAARTQLATERGRIRVGSDCASLSDSRIYAIGDVAHFVPEGEEKALPGLAPVAMQQGKHVARNILRDVANRPSVPFKYKDKGIMATVGRSRAVVEASGFHLTGFIAWLAWCLVHVALLVSFRNRLIVMFNWFWSYLTFRRGARLIKEPFPEKQSKGASISKPDSSNDVHLG